MLRGFPQALAARVRPESLPAYELLYKTAEEIAAKRDEQRRAAEAAQLKVGRAAAARWLGTRSCAALAQKGLRCQGLLLLPWRGWHSAMCLRLKGGRGLFSLLPAGVPVPPRHGG